MTNTAAFRALEASDGRTWSPCLTPDNSRNVGLGMTIYNYVSAPVGAAYHKQGDKYEPLFIKKYIERYTLEWRDCTKGAVL